MIQNGTEFLGNEPCVGFVVEGEVQLCCLTRGTRRGYKSAYIEEDVIELGSGLNGRGGREGTDETRVATRPRELGKG